jgi:hypothetical protein
MDKSDAVMRISAFGSHEIALGDFVLTVMSAITTVVLIKAFNSWIIAQAGSYDSSGANFRLRR